MEVVLASQSPRRRMLLEAAGFRVRQQPVEIEETILDGETPEAAARRLAVAKAEAAPATNLPVIAADTLVAISGRILGKPRDLADAEAMLKTLFGRTHTVITGVAVRRGTQLRASVVRTQVRMRTPSDEELRAYLAHNAVLDKAGAYAIQEGAASFVVGVRGPLDNVIGLPVACVRELLR